MTQAMIHFQREEHCCFVCGDTGHFAKECPHRELFHSWLKQHAHSHGAEPKSKAPISEEKPAEVAMRVINIPIKVKTIETEPTMRWIGPQTVVDIIIEGQEAVALADSGSQVNTIMPEFANDRDYLILPLEKLVNHPVNLVGIGGQHTHPFGFMITRLQVKEVAGYNEDIVFLVVPDQSAFSRRVPLMLGTCTLERIINVIKESELDQLAMPWATICLAQLLSQRGGVEDTSQEGAVGGQEDDNVEEINVVVELKDSVCMGPFQMEILRGKVKELPTCITHVMITPVRYSEVKKGQAHLLPPGLQVLYAYFTLTAGNHNVPSIVRNMSDCAILLKKDTPVTQMVSATLVSPANLTPEEETVTGAEALQEKMSIEEHKHKLLEKLNLDSLSQWSPHNTATARELLLSYHDVFMLGPSKLGCTSTIKHEIRITDDEPFKECFRHIPPPLLEEVHASLRDMLEARAI